MKRDPFEFSRGGHGCRRGGRLHHALLSLGLVDEIAEGIKCQTNIGGIGKRRQVIVFSKRYEQCERKSYCPTRWSVSLVTSAGEGAYVVPAGPGRLGRERSVV